MKDYYARNKESILQRRREKIAIQQGEGSSELECTPTGTLLLTPSMKCLMQQVSFSMKLKVRFVSNTWACNP